MLLLLTNYHLLLTVLACLAGSSRCTNLVCNGDFESYSVTSSITYDGIVYWDALIPNNYSCWWANKCGLIEVLRTIYGTGTQATELSTLLTCPIDL